MLLWTDFSNTGFSHPTYPRRGNVTNPTEEQVKEILCSYEY